MRSLFEDEPDLFALKLIALLLGVGFIVGGILKAALAGEAGMGPGLTLMALGCYVTAASALGLTQGQAAQKVFAPACIAALSALLVVGAAGGMFATVPPPT
jgi:hypothetical protein